MLCKMVTSTTSTLSILFFHFNFINSTDSLTTACVQYKDNATVHLISREIAFNIDTIGPTGISNNVCMRPSTPECPFNFHVLQTKGPSHYVVSVENPKKIKIRKEEFCCQESTASSNRLQWAFDGNYDCG